MPDPFLCGICLGFVGTADYPRFIIKDEKGQATLYWDGIRFTKDRNKATVYADFETVRDEAWRLRGEYLDLDHVTECLIGLIQRATLAPFSSSCFQRDFINLESKLAVCICRVRTNRIVLKRTSHANERS